MATSKPTAEERLIAAASLLGLANSVQLLQEQIVRDVLRVVQTMPFRNLASEVEQMLKPSYPRPTKPVKRKALTAVVRPDGDSFITTISDGRVWRSKRRRDLVLRARRQGLVVKSLP